MDSYSNENISYIAEYLKAQKPDIITLQETHTDDSGSQAKEISEQLCLPYFVNDIYDNSHIDSSQKLCQSIISRFPTTEHYFTLFFNPRYRKVMEDGSEWVSHDKGISTVVIDVEGTPLTIQTLHLIPFRKFDADISDEEGEKMISSVQDMIEKGKTPYLLQGDFNYPNVKELLPDIFSQGQHEVGGDAATTPKGRIYDHVLFRGMKQAANPLIDSNVLTDHYPVITWFEL